MSQNHGPRSTIWTSTKQIIHTLNNASQREKMDYFLYQHYMTKKELKIFHTFALYLREKQSIQEHVSVHLENIIENFVESLQ